MDQVPFWRLSSFYFYYFGLLGCISPFWGLYLSAQGMSVVQIGTLMGLFGVTRIVAPLLWGWIADHISNKLSLLRTGTAMGTIAFVGMFFVSEFYGLAAIMVLYGFFWAAVLPQFEVLTLNYLNGHMGLYSKVRLWGSVGFMAMVVGLGALFDFVSMTTLPAFMLALFILVFLTTVSLPPISVNQSQGGGDSVWWILIKPYVLAFLFSVFLLQLSFGAYYTFFSLYLEQHGYDKLTIGLLWALGVFAEVLAFYYMSHIIRLFTMKYLLVISLVLASVRWYLTGHWVDILSLLVVLQLTHAASFGVMHTVSMHYVRQYFPGENQSKGQSIFSSLSYGAGGAVGAYLAGILWGEFNPVVMFSVAAACALLAAVVAFLFVDAKKVRAR